MMQVHEMKEASYRIMHVDSGFILKKNIKVIYLYVHITQHGNMYTKLIEE